MSENIYAEPGITKTVHFDRDDKESIVDIYVSAESLRVYDNPWVEGTSANMPGPAGPQHSGMDVSNKRCKRADRFLGYFSCLNLCAMFVCGSAGWFCCL